MQIFLSLQEMETTYGNNSFSQQQQEFMKRRARGSHVVTPHAN